MDVNLTQNTSNPTQSVIQGGPVDIVNPQPQVDPAPQAPTQNAPIAPQIQNRIIIGNRIFGTQEEADSYLADLEARTRVPAPQAPGQTLQADPNPEEILFEDPKRAIALLEERIRNSIRTEGQVERNKTRVWDEFYQQHPDLSNFKDLVQLEFQKLAAASPNTPVTTALPNVAAQTRAYISKIRGIPNGGQPLSDKPAIVAGASGPTPPPTIQQKPAPTSFVDELKSNWRGSKHG